MEAWGKTGSEEISFNGGGVHDVAQVALSSFIDNEDKNFRLFNHVIEQQNEIDMLESQVQSLHAEEKHYTHKVGIGREKTRQTMENLESRFKETQVESQFDCSNVELFIPSRKGSRVVLAHTTIAFPSNSPASCRIAVSHK